MSAKFNSEITVIGIDIGKNSFHVVGLDRRGAIRVPSSAMKSRRFIALTPDSRIMGSIAGQGRASQQKPPFNVR